MCPVCLTTAALIAGSVTSTGGLAAIVIRKFGAKNTEDKRRSGHDDAQDRNTRTLARGADGAA